MWTIDNDWSVIIALLGSYQMHVTSIFFSLSFFSLCSVVRNWNVLSLIVRRKATFVAWPEIHFDLHSGGGSV